MEDIMLNISFFWSC